jgi:hypothetical protein
MASAILASFSLENIIYMFLVQNSVYKSIKSFNLSLSGILESITYE